MPDMRATATHRLIPVTETQIKNYSQLYQLVGLLALCTSVPSANQQQFPFHPSAFVCDKILKKAKVFYILGCCSNLGFVLMKENIWGTSLELVLEF